jgi:hypothetical protein
MRKIQALFMHKTSHKNEMESETQNFHPALTVILKTVQTTAFVPHETWDMHACVEEWGGGD